MEHSDRTGREAGPTRRRVVLDALVLASAALAGCGGGGGDAGSPSPGGPLNPPPSGPAGRLVYRNSGQAATFNTATGAEVVFDPGIRPSTDPGITASRGGVVTVAREPLNDGFELAFYNLSGVLQTTRAVARTLAFQNGAAVFNAAGTRIALSVDEPATPNSGTRISRTLVYDYPAMTQVAALDGYEEPVWAGTAGELLVRDPVTLQLHLFNSSLVHVGRVGGFVLESLFGAYNVSADGRYVVYSDQNVVHAYDRSTGNSWVACQDATSDTMSPTLSPDGNFLAVIARDLLVFVPHIVAFSPGSTVQLDSARHAIKTQLADVRSRMDWTA